MRAAGRLLYFRKQPKEDADDSTDWDELHGRKGQINIMTDVNEILNWDDAVSEQSLCAVLGEGRPPAACKVDRIEKQRIRFSMIRRGAEAGATRPA
jgi:hypothetical protein